MFKLLPQIIDGDVEWKIADKCSVLCIAPPTSPTPLLSCTIIGWFLFSSSGGSYLILLVVTTWSWRGVASSGCV